MLQLHICTESRDTGRTAFSNKARPGPQPVDDAEDRIFALESARRRIQVYNKEKDYEEHSIRL
ncbi:MAG: hypothetical protein J4N93_09685 [Chloroflexi bacterium]|nr:hypothetical protein [Chloroflexota bacterium]